MAFTDGLTGARVGAWNRRGKYLTAALEPDRGVWGVHLRMTGQFQWIEQPTDACSHTRVRFWNPKGDDPEGIQRSSKTAMETFLVFNNCAWKMFPKPKELFSDDLWQDSQQASGTTSGGAG